MFGLEIGLIIKAVLAITAVGGVLLAIRSYGKLKEGKGREEGIQEAEKEYAENYKELADDVLDGGHPYGVRGSSIAEISSPKVDTPDRMASDIHRDGGEGGSNGSSASTS